MWNLANNFSDTSLACSLGAAASLAALIGVHQYYKNKYSYWSRRGVKGPKPWLVLGNVTQMFSDNWRQVSADWRRQFGSVYGLYTGASPMLAVGDPEIVRQICIKDFDAFPNHDADFNASELQENFIFFAQDERWRHLRVRLSPTFTSGKMRRMHKLLLLCADDLVDSVGEQLERAQGAAALVHLKDTLNLYTMDAIASCCYGLKLERDKSVNDLKTAANRNEFVRLALDMFKLPSWRLVITFALSTRLQKLLGFKLVPDSQMSPFAARVQQLIDRRRRDSSSRKFDDYLQILLDSGRVPSGNEQEFDRLDLAEQHHTGQMEPGEECAGSHQERGRQLSEMEILASASMLLVVGLDTTSNLLTNCIYTLAYNKHVQDRLCEEVSRIAVRTESGGLHFEYDTITSCHYLDSVLSEALRILAPAPQTSRVASRDYYLEKYDILLAKGTKVAISVSDLMLDEQFWPEPHKFDPERFMPQNRHKIVPGSYLPFGMGPRHCLGMRFALAEAKLALAKLSMEFEFTPAPGKKFPPDFKLFNIREPLVRVERRVKC